MGGGSATGRTVVGVKREEPAPAANASGGAGDVLRFVVPGEPVPKGRPRTFLRRKRNGEPFVTTTTPPETRAFEERVKLVATAAASGIRWAWVDGDRFQILVRVIRRYWDKGGDLDNYVKTCTDSIIGVAFRDDRYVRGIGATFGRPDPKNPRVEIEVRRIPKGGA